MKLTSNSINFKLLSRGIALSGAIIVISCQSGGNEIEMVAQKIKDNNCSIHEISEFVDGSWTESIEELGKLLPKDLPEQERENIMNLKSANLIRMFESYKDFDPPVHALLDSMERVDAYWADSLRTLSQQNQMLEMKIDSLLTTVQDIEEEKMLSQRVDQIRSAPCDDM